MCVQMYVFMYVNTYYLMRQTQIFPGFVSLIRIAQRIFNVRYARTHACTLTVHWCNGAIDKAHAIYFLQLFFIRPVVREHRSHTPEPLNDVYNNLKKFKTSSEPVRVILGGFEQ